MTVALLIAAHHLRRLARSPGLVLLLMAIPMSLALIEYAAFGRAASSGKLPPITVLVLDEDDTFVSSAVPQFFAGGPMKEHFEIATIDDRDGVRRRFERNEASALIVVPKGFQDALLDGRKAELQLYKNPIQTFSPEVAGSVLDMAVAVGNGLYAQAREPIARIRQFVEAGREPAEDDIAEISRGFYRAGERFARLGALADLAVDVQRPSGSRQSAGIGSNPREFFAYMFPGLVLFALMFISQALASRLLRDRTRGLQRRLAIAPASRASVLAGGILYLVSGLVVVLVLLALLGSLVFRIQLRNPIALVTLGLGFAVFAAGLQLTIAGLAKSHRGAEAVGGVIVMVLSLLGGTFVPAETYPPFLRAVAFVVPNGAAQQGMVDILVHHRTFAEIGLRAMTAWMWGIAALVAAIAIERRRLTM